MVDDIGIGVVSAFLENFDIADISSCRDAYMGCYESGAEFAQSTLLKIVAMFLEECQVG